MQGIHSVNALEPNMLPNNKKAQQLFKADNPLVHAAMPLLAFMVNIKNTQELIEIAGLHERLIGLIQDLEYQAKLSGYSQRHILAARYCLCTALDEAVLNTSWGERSYWAQQSLLATLHNETWGGERFYIIVEKMSAEAESALDLLVLLYLILSLGFEGKYYSNKIKCGEVIDDLFHTLTLYKRVDLTPLSIHGESYAKNPINQDPIIPIWIYVTTVVCSLCLLAIILQYYSNQITTPLLNRIYPIANSFHPSIDKDQLGLRVEHH